MQYGAMNIEHDVLLSRSIFFFVVVALFFFTVICQFAGMRFKLPDPFPTCAEVAKRICWISYSTPTVWSRPRIADPTGTDAATRELWISNKLLREIWGDGTYTANSDFGRDSTIRIVSRRMPAARLTIPMFHRVCQPPFCNEESKV